MSENQSVYLHLLPIQSIFYSNPCGKIAVLVTGITIKERDRKETYNRIEKGISS